MRKRASGLLLLDKPEGVTSFQALSRVKRVLNEKRVGHTGTLDKFASGILVVLTGQFTKLVPHITGMDKTYEGIICFGKETDTLDPEGALIQTAPVPDLGTIEEVLPTFRGTIKQRPPAYSAIHINGKRAHERVRAGEIVEMPGREVQIKELSILGWKPPYLTIKVICGKGTYIRSLARDLGRSSGSCGYLTSLRRTAVGPYLVEDGKTPEEFSPESDFFEGIKAIDRIGGIQKILLDKQSIKQVLTGAGIEKHLSGFTHPQEGYFAFIDEDNQFIALCSHRGETYKYEFVIPKQKYDFKNGKQ
ncbi:MAG: tRNA pseudouridine(55) synthase TruB [Spirochaetales bacterium]|nr:tRNA pseudouridine(55) synthase TruB [Spirochaetales bacterium]